MSAFWLLTAAVWIIVLLETISDSGLIGKIYIFLGELLGINNARQVRETKAELMKVRREMNGVSAMDEFAKWARLKRQLDKHATEYERLLSAQTIGKSAFEVKLQLAIRAISYVGYAWLLYRYYNQPVFHLPVEWGGALGSLLRLPSAPFGMDKNH